MPDIDAAVIPEDVLERCGKVAGKTWATEVWWTKVAEAVLLAAGYPALCERVAELEDERAELQETRKALATVGEERADAIHIASVNGKDARQFKAERDEIIKGYDSLVQAVEVLALKFGNLAELTDDSEERLCCIGEFIDKEREQRDEAIKERDEARYSLFNKTLLKDVADALFGDLDQQALDLAREYRAERDALAAQNVVMRDALERALPFFTENPCDGECNKCNGDLCKKVYNAISNALSTPPTQAEQRVLARLDAPKVQS